MNDDGLGAAFAAADDGAQPGQQFGHVEGLDQVVVCAEVEALDAVGQGVARCHNDDRQGRGAAQMLEHVQPRAIGQVEVERHRGIGAGRQGLDRRVTRLRPVGGIAALRKAGHQGPA